MGKKKRRSCSSCIKYRKKRIKKQKGGFFLHLIPEKHRPGGFHGRR